MKQLLKCSCIDWCDGESASSTCDNNSEFVNNVGRSIFVHNRMVHPRGGCWEPSIILRVPVPRPQRKKSQSCRWPKALESGRMWDCEQTHERVSGLSARSIGTNHCYLNCNCCYHCRA